MSAPLSYDAVLLVSFGGPEKHEDVIPFLENVVRGRNVPRGRLLEVAEHYYHLGGRSPINEQNRALIRALEARLERDGPRLPVYWGNRNWPPLLTDAMRRMAAGGVRRALAFVTSAYSSYSSCRQYLEDIARARAEAGPSAPVVDKLRVFYNHPGFVESMIERTRAALETMPPDRRVGAELIFTAHSIPVAMAQACRYQAQLREAARLVAAGLGRQDFQVVYQSRSGPPDQPWLEPDVCDYLTRLAGGERRDVVVVPIGFVSDHLEVLYDLDREARALAGSLGLNLARAATVGDHPRFVEMIRELILERINAGEEAEACPPECCMWRVP